MKKEIDHDLVFDMQLELVELDDRYQAALDELAEWRHPDFFAATVMLTYRLIADGEMSLDRGLEYLMCWNCTRSGVSFDRKSWEKSCAMWKKFNRNVPTRLAVG